MPYSWLVKCQPESSIVSRRLTADDAAPVSLADEAYLALRELIVTCDLLPGQRVTERQLAADLGFGLTPTRQALARLDTEGLVRTLPRRGYQIEPLTIGSVNELFQLWRIIGPHIVELAARNLPAHQREKLFNDRFATVRGAYANGDPVAAIDETASFWLWLVKTTRNSRLLELYTRLEGELRRVFILVFKDPSAEEVIGPGIRDTWPPGAKPERWRQHAETFIDTAHRLLLGILASWPSVVQAEVVPPGSWTIA